MSNEATKYVAKSLRARARLAVGAALRRTFVPLSPGKVLLEVRADTKSLPFFGGFLRIEVFSPASHAPLVSLERALGAQSVEHEITIEDLAVEGSWAVVVTLFKEGHSRSSRTSSYGSGRHHQQ